MKFRFVKKVEGSVPVYGGQTASTGDILEYQGHLAEKAKANPDFVMARESKKKGENPDDDDNPDS